MTIDIKTIPHSEQRYHTCGDYYRDSKETNMWRFRISEIGRSEYEFLILIHELVEWFLCWIRGIDFDEIDAFDIDYEENRKDGDTSEPGDSPDAPYHWEHWFATTIERMLAVILGVDWEEYEKAIDEL